MPERILDDNLTITTKAGSTASFPVKAQVLAKDVRFFGFEDGKNGDLSVKDLTFIRRRQQAGYLARIQLTTPTAATKSPSW